VFPTNLQIVNWYYLDRSKSVTFHGDIFKIGISVYLSFFFIIIDIVIKDLVSKSRKTSSITTYIVTAQWQRWSIVDGTTVITKHSYT